MASEEEIRQEERERAAGEKALAQARALLAEMKAELDKRNGK